MPIPTKPLVLGAPLSAEDYEGPVELHLPSTEDIRAEWLRAKIELMYAIARHRKAWARMRGHHEEAKARAVWADSYPPYKEAVGDVRWWREEMNAQAATVTALTALLTADPK